MKDFQASLDNKSETLSQTNQPKEKQTKKWKKKKKKERKCRNKASGAFF